MVGVNERLLRGSEYPDDTGEATPLLAAALAGYAADESRYTDVLAALAGSRVLVPVVAVLGEVELDAAGLARDKSSDMAAVLLRGVDGRSGLLAFSSTATLSAWNPEGRPVPVPTRTAALSALQEGAAALVVDVAGPVTIAVEGEDLRALAAGWRLARVGERVGWVAPPD
jgi:hypothetical protein